jgi:hypothetical protein
LRPDFPIDANLGKVCVTGRFCYGDRPTIADICLVADQCQGAM